MIKLTEGSQPFTEGDEFHICEAYSLMDAVAREEGWDDPEMDSYNIYKRNGGMHGQP
jgi:hypothetical protein